MLDNLTPDEQIIRTYYLTGEFSRRRQCLSELPYLAPVVVIALLPKRDHGDVSLYVALVYLMIVYVWRMGGMRWLRATAGLVRKYEEKLGESRQDSQRTE
jgi:hypothetical protein